VTEQAHWQEGMGAQENMIFACFGCLSNTGIVAGLGSLKAAKERGLDQVAVGCLVSLTLGVALLLQRRKR